MPPIYFGYERAPTGNWCPVCYHGTKPGKSVNGGSTEFRFMTEVGDEYLDAAGEPMFGKLRADFPLEGEIST